MKRDQWDHLPREILRQLDAGRLQMAETHLALSHLLACRACLTSYRSLLGTRRVSPIPRGEALLSGWGREDHLDFEILRTLVDLRLRVGRKERSRHREDAPSESALGWALEHLAQCRLCQWAVEDLGKFVMAQRVPRGIPANRRRGRAAMGLHLCIGKRGRAGGGRWFFLSLGVGALLLFGELSLT
jgi:hypothetical protein